jgi:hypothetical protein
MPGQAARAACVDSGSERKDTFLTEQTPRGMNVASHGATAQADGNPPAVQTPTIHFLAKRQASLNKLEDPLKQLGARIGLSTRSQSEIQHFGRGSCPEKVSRHD